MIPRKFAVIGVVALLILLVISVFLFFAKENKKVTFTIDYPGASATISKKGSTTPIATISDGSSLFLAKQTYTIIFTDQTFNQTPIEVEVDEKTTSIQLSPVLSDSKLKEMLAAEKSAIDTAIKNTIKNASRYAEGKRTLYHYGEWCTTSFQVAAPRYSNDPNIGSLDTSETYYLVLQKKDNGWEVVAGPHIIITKPDNPNVPDYVIDAIDPSRDN